MSLGERIKKVRKDLGLTQQAFAEQIGSTQNALTGYETGRRNPSAAALNNICKTFNVSEVWLRTGEGEPFVPAPSGSLDELIQEYRLDELDREIISEFAKLDEKAREAVKLYIKNVSRRLYLSQEEKTPAPKVDAKNETTTQSEPDLAAKVAALERQNQELAAEIAALKEEDELSWPSDTGNLA